MVLHAFVPLHRVSYIFRVKKLTLPNVSTANSNGLSYTSVPIVNSVSGVNVTTIVGASSCGSTDGTGTGARLQTITDMCIDPTSTYIYVMSVTLMRKITVATMAVSTIVPAGESISFGGYCFLCKRVCLGSFTSTTRCVVSPSFIYFTHSHFISKVMVASPYTVSFFAGSPISSYVDGNATASRFYYPQGMVFNPTYSAFYLADNSNNCIRKFTNPEASLVVTTFATGLTNPSVLVMDNTKQNLFVSSYSSLDSIYRVSLSTGFSMLFAGISKFVLLSEIHILIFDTGNVGGYLDGSVSMARFNYIQAIAIDAVNNIYICDTFNYGIRMIINSTASVVTVAGNSKCSWCILI